ncbi:39S ribosomal protein L55, mitochondrial [Alligator sinensis]|uniref:39S ribosomal protein L55, mitochondrial n=1 Tax=Alligator sinensis TaxID=38654 RepID=A0A1U7S2P1_ALLSI|nr:39S ribosomal protein L55, mitochondrial [Alligator sinensis]XP_025067400.1 39S ribosomal protein L55, mitochondrial [Alligator sinensis]
MCLIHLGPFSSSVIARTSMAAVSRSLSLLRGDLIQRSLPTICSLHTTPSQHNSNRTSITSIRRQTYGRVYPVLLIRPDGSTVHIRYKEPRWILTMPVDLNTLPEAERRARLRKRDRGKLQIKQERLLEDDFNMDRYKEFWKKK